MTGLAARRLAERVHGDAPDRYGAALLDHVRRVAAAVPREARTVAWLHEVLEYAAASAQDLRAAGASEDEIAAVQLLTRDTDADADADEAAYDAHIALIAETPGPAGRLARIVKRADLHDRLRHQDAQAATSVVRPAYRAALARLAAVPTTIDTSAAPRRGRRGLRGARTGEAWSV